MIIYYSASENGEGEYTSLGTFETNEATVDVPFGKHYYFKVRMVSTINNNQTIYSDFSNVIDFDNSTSVEG